MCSLWVVGQALLSDWSFKLYWGKATHQKASDIAISSNTWGGRFPKTPYPGLCFLLGPVSVDCGSFPLSVPPTHTLRGWADGKVHDYYDLNIMTMKYYDFNSHNIMTMKSEGKKTCFPHTYLLDETLSVVLWDFINIPLTAPSWSLG